MTGQHSLYGGGTEGHAVCKVRASDLPIWRVMVAVLENYQQPGGTVKVPEVLQPYLKQE